MKDKQKLLHVSLWLLIFILGLYIIIKGGQIGKVAFEEKGYSKRFFRTMGKELDDAAFALYMPGFVYQAGKGEEKGMEQQALNYIFRSIPLYEFIERQAIEETEIESTPAYEKILEAEARDGAHEATNQEKEQETKSQVAEDQKETEIEEAQNQGTQEVLPVAEIPMERLNDFDYFIKNFFVVDGTTTVDQDRMNGPLLLGKNLSIEKKQEPQILIYHTHSQEDFVDSIPGDPSTSIVAVGEYLTKLLQDKYGYQVIHHTGVYDMVGGELDRDKAYRYAGEAVEKILEENPSIEVVIDLHRDGVNGKKFVTDINGKPTARFMFFNGLSRTAQNGDISYLPNPYITDNLAFSFQLQLKAAQFYPGLTRNIYLRPYRYNLHYKPRSLLIESGTQLNTVQEELNAMEPLAEILDQVLSGK